MKESFSSERIVESHQSRRAHEQTVADFRGILLAKQKCGRGVHHSKYRAVCQNQTPKNAEEHELLRTSRPVRSRIRGARKIGVSKRTSFINFSPPTLGAGVYE